MRLRKVAAILLHFIGGFALATGILLGLVGVFIKGFATDFSEARPKAQGAKAPAKETLVPPPRALQVGGLK